MSNGSRADELSCSSRQIAAASTWSLLMAGFFLAAISVSAVKQIEIAAIF